MGTFYLAFTVVFPLFVLMALGYFLRYIKLFDDAFLKRLNALNFKVFLPLVLFLSVYNSDFQKDFSWKLVSLGIFFLVLSFVVLMLVVPKFEPDNMRRGVMVQGIFRSNYILFGLPVAKTLCGTEGMSVTVMLISFAVPMLNILSVVALETYGSQRSSFKRILKGLANNPLIVAAFIGMVVVILGIRLPVVLADVITDVSGIATPLALIILGGSFYFSSIKRILRPLSIAVLGRLVIIPALIMPIFIAMGFRGPELVSVFCLFASPTAVSSYTMAQSMDCDAELAGQIVVMSSLCSLFTIFWWVSALTHFALI